MKKSEDKKSFHFILTVGNRVFGSQPPFNYQFLHTPLNICKLGYGGIASKKCKDAAIRCAGKILKGHFLG